MGCIEKIGGLQLRMKEQSRNVRLKNFKKNIEEINTIGDGKQISPKEAEKIFESLEASFEKTKKRAEAAAKNRVDLKNVVDYDHKAEEKSFMAFMRYLKGESFQIFNDFLKGC